LDTPFYVLETSRLGLIILNWMLDEHCVRILLEMVMIILVLY